MVFANHCGGALEAERSAISGQFVRIASMQMVALALSLFLAAEAISAQCLPTSWVISGIVVDSNGDGVAGVDIDIISLSTGQPLSLSQDFTFFDGSFSLAICETVTPGFFDVIFQVSPTEPFFDLSLQTVNLSGNTDLGSVILEDSGIVSGTVVTETGVPLQFIDLDFFDPVSGQPTVFSGDTTDANGNFSVKVTPAFWDVRFTAGPASSPLDLVPVLRSDLAVFGSTPLGDVVLRNGYTLSGTVLDGSGSPVDGGDIDVRDPITGDKLLTPGDNTNGSGVFSVLVPSGDWQLEVDPPQGSMLVSSLTAISIPVGGINLGVLTLPDGFTVSGSVVNSSGQVVPETDLDFYISATGIEIPTAHDNANSSGVFSVQVVPDTYDIAFRPRFISGAAPVVIEDVVVAGNTGLGSVLVPPGFALTGTVVAGPTPVEEVEITLTDSSTGVPAYTFGNDTDGLGGFALRQVGGTYDVTATPLVATGLNPVVVLDLVLGPDVNIAIDLLGGGTPIPPDPVVALECVLNSGSVQLDWTLGNVDYDQIQLSRGGSILADLPGDFTGYLDVNAPQSLLEYSVIAIRDGLTSPPESCLVDNTPVVTPPPPVVALGCETVPSGVDLLWTLGAPDYDLIQVTRNGVFVSNLGGSVTQYSDLFAPAAILEYSLTAIRNGLASTPELCTVDNTTPVPSPSPVTNLQCEQVSGGVSLAWQNADPDYDTIEIWVDGSLLAVLGGQDTTFMDAVVTVGSHQYQLIAWRNGLESASTTCDIDVTSVGLTFLRGDANEDLVINLGDVISILSYLFASGSAPDCVDALDTNDSGGVNIADAINELSYLFSGGPPPAPPFPDVGVDPTPDSLPCP